MLFAGISRTASRSHAPMDGYTTKNKYIVHPNISAMVHRTRLDAVGIYHWYLAVASLLPAQKNVIAIADNK